VCTELAPGFLRDFAGRIGEGRGDTMGTHVSVDLNRLDHSSVLGCPTGVTEVLNGHADWGPAPGQSVFVYNFQCKPAGED